MIWGIALLFQTVTKLGERGKQNMESRKLKFACTISSATIYFPHPVHRMQDTHDVENDKGEQHMDDHENECQVDGEGDGGWAVDPVHAAPFANMMLLRR